MEKYTFSVIKFFTKMFQVAVALLQAEKNIIHLNAGLSLLGHLFCVWVFCVHFILFIKLFLCSISFKFMQSNIRGVNH